MANKKITTLRRKSDFETLKKRGKRIYANSWLILNYLQNSESTNRYGWIIPKKVGGSVLRNRLKRWCREYFRNLRFHPEKHFDVNVIIRANSDASYFRKLTFKEFKDELDSAVKKVR